MKKLEKRNNIRIYNQIQILDLLRKQKMTVTDLADKLGISFTAVSHIIEDMVSQKILKYSSKKSVNGRGRIPMFVEINNETGVVCGVDLSSKDIQILISTLDGKILARDEIKDSMFILKEHFNKIEESINKMMSSPSLKKYKLLSICIASPGLIRPETQEYVDVYRVVDFAKLNPVLHFTNAFGVKVEMYNDIRVACLAELKFGAFPKRPFNGLFVHIGSGSGLTCIFDGKIYKGTNGFSGEMPVYIGNDPIIKKSYWNTRLFSFWEIEKLRNKLKGRPEVEPSSKGIDIDKIIDDFHKGDKETLEAVEESCKRNAITLIGLSTLLDIEYIVVEGPIQKLGDVYMQKLRKYIAEFSEHDIRTRLVPSTVGVDGSTVGACYQASSSYFLDQIESVTKKRIKVDEVNIDSDYKEI